MYEQTTLGEVEEYGEELELLDGQRFKVKPSDAPIVSTWLPTTQLDITETDSDSMFSIKIRNVALDREVSAMRMD